MRCQLPRPSAPAADPTSRRSRHRPVTSCCSATALTDGYLTRGKVNFTTYRAIFLVLVTVKSQPYRPRVLPLQRLRRLVQGWPCLSQYATVGRGPVLASDLYGIGACIVRNRIGVRTRRTVTHGAEPPGETHAHRRGPGLIPTSGWEWLPTSFLPPRWRARSSSQRLLSHRAQASRIGSQDRGVSTPPRSEGLRGVRRSTWTVPRAGC